MHRTWALKGVTPVIQSAGSWKKLTLIATIITTSKGARSRLFLRSIVGAANGERILRYLTDLKREMCGRKLLLIWDGLPAHRARNVQTWVRENHSWLRVERLPAYAPELNPVEYFWSSLKRRKLGNLGGDFAKLGAAIHRCRRSMNDRKLLRGFLKASGLY